MDNKESILRHAYRLESIDHQILSLKESLNEIKIDGSLNKGLNTVDRLNEN